MTGEQLIQYLTSVTTNLRNASNPDEFEAAMGLLQQQSGAFEHEVSSALDRLISQSDEKTKEIVTTLLALIEWNKIVMMLFVNPLMFANPALAEQLRKDGEDDEGDDGEDDEGEDGEETSQSISPTDEQKAGLDAVFSALSKPAKKK